MTVTLPAAPAARRLPATVSGDVVRADRMTVTRADGTVYLDESVAGFGTDTRRSAATHHVAANRSVRFYRTGSPAAYFRTRDRVVPAR